MNEFFSGLITTGQQTQQQQQQQQIRGNQIAFNDGYSNSSIIDQSKTNNSSYSLKSCCL